MVFKCGFVFTASSRGLFLLLGNVNLLPYIVCQPTLSVRQCKAVAADTSLGSVIGIWRWMCLMCRERPPFPASDSPSRTSEPPSGSFGPLKSPSTCVIVWKPSCWTVPRKPLPSTTWHMRSSSDLCQCIVFDFIDSCLPIRLASLLLQGLHWSLRKFRVHFQRRLSFHNEAPLRCDHCFRHGLPQCR